MSWPATAGHPVDSVSRAPGGVDEIEKKTMNNSIVEASTYRNESFVPEKRNEFHAREKGGGFN
jgi:hypothetical protein